MIFGGGNGSTIPVGVQGRYHAAGNTGIKDGRTRNPYEDTLRYIHPFLTPLSPHLESRPDMERTPVVSRMRSYTLDGGRQRTRGLSTIP